MAFVVQDVFEEARNSHFLFNERDHPDPALLSRLNAEASRLRHAIMEIDETALATTQTQAMPLAVHANGIPLTAGTLNLIAVAAQPSGTPAPSPVPVEVIPHAHRFDIGPATLAAWEVNGTLYLRSPATLWQNITEVGILSIPAWVKLTTVEVTVPLPDDCASVLATDLAQFMAGRRTVEKGAIDSIGFRQEAARVRALFLQSIGARVAGRVYRTRDVMGG